jgi:hypothetical protein
MCGVASAHFRALPEAAHPDTLSFMKAIVITRLGGPEVLEIRDVEEPSVAQGQVPVRVQAGG